MKKASNFLIGHHDFTSFRSISCQASSPLRTIDKINFDINDDLIEMRIEAKDDEEKFKITTKAIEYFTKNYECITVDGVRIKFGDGWGLVRSSNTQPVIVCRFEANSIDRRDEIMNLVMDKLKEFGNLKLGGH